MSNFILGCVSEGAWGFVLVFVVHIFLVIALL